MTPQQIGELIISGAQCIFWGIGFGLPLLFARKSGELSDPKHREHESEFTMTFVGVMIQIIFAVAAFKAGVRG